MKENNNMKIIEIMKIIIIMNNENNEMKINGIIIKWNNNVMKNNENNK